MANEDWMAGFTNRDDLALRDITIPASHDAGLSEDDDCYIPYGRISSRAHVICQYHNIAGQLEAGSRAFDLRIAKKSGVLRCFHGEGVFGSMGGGWGQRAVEIFQQVNTFLTNHPGEIVILRISHTKETAGVHNAILGNIDGERLYKSGPRNIATAPLSRLRGKAIAIFDGKALENTRTLDGLHRLVKHDPDNPKHVGLPIFGKYAGQDADFKTMVQVAIKKGNKHGALTRSIGTKKHTHLFMIYWQLAMDVKTKTTNGQDERDENLRRVESDKGTHYNLDYILNLHRGLAVSGVKKGIGKTVKTKVTQDNRAWHRPNIINLDFVNEISVNKIIAFNNDLLPPAPGG